MAVIDEELIERYVEPRPALSGTNGARLRDYGVSVWALVAYSQAADGDVDRVDAGLDRPALNLLAVTPRYMIGSRSPSVTRCCCASRPREGRSLVTETSTVRAIQT